MWDKLPVTEAYLSQVFFLSNGTEFPQRAGVTHLREIRVTSNGEASYAEDKVWR